MEVSAREAFKLGFLLRCQEERLTPEQINQRIKAASSDFPSARDMLAGIVDTMKATSKEHPMLTGAGALGLGIGLPVAAGWGAGHAARKLQGDFLDPEDVKKQELINEMNTLSDRSHISQSKALGL